MRCRQIKKSGILRWQFFRFTYRNDIHGEGFAEHMKTIEAQNPDVVLIVGDFVDDDTTKEDRTSLRIMQEAVRRRKN